MDAEASPATSADEMALWASSGAMWLTGRSDGPPLPPPAGLVSKLGSIGASIERSADDLGGRIEVDPLEVLGQRAAISGFHRRGATSCGGSTRLVEAGDRWVAVSLVRPGDTELLPAWLHLVDVPDEPWAAIERAAATRPAAELIDAGRELGLAVALLPDGPIDVELAAAPLAPLPVTAHDLGPRGDGRRSIAGAVVVDLSSLWAGPLCGSLLAAAGATVIKVESTRRPDGMRRGPAAFFDLLNGTKRSVALDLRPGRDVDVLKKLLRRADIVIEASRPRALEQLGIHAAELLGDSGGPRVWVSITGHGRGAPGRDWVAFGDDAAVAGGLVAHDADGPVFCADAVADPAAGLVAAAAALDAYAADRRWLLDVAMSNVAAHLAGPPLAAPDPSICVERPVAARPVRPAPLLGADTAVVLDELGIG